MAAKAKAGAPFERLTRSGEFEALRRGKGVTVSFGRLRGIARAGGEDASPSLRFGLIVPKKLGNAPRRNRMKRRLREGLRLARLSGRLDPQRFSAGIGADIGIFPAATVLNMEFEALSLALCAGVAALMRKLAPNPI